MKDMKKLVKQEGKVRGSMDPALMTELLDNGVSVPFWSIDSAMPDSMPSGIAMSIQDYGYISIEDVFRWLGLTDPVLRRHWQPYFNEAAGRSEAVRIMSRAIPPEMSEIFLKKPMTFTESEASDRQKGR